MLSSTKTAPADAVIDAHHTGMEQPVGSPVDAKPAQRPGAVTLSGRFGRVEKLKPGHAGDLWAVLEGHERIWTYMPSYGPFADAAAFTQWIGAQASMNDPYSYCIVDPSGRALGISALMGIRPEHRVVEIGQIVYSPRLQRSALATEAQYLLARYAFETLRFRRYEWKCDARNAASRRAALRYGFRFEGIFRQHMIARGHNRDTAWYSMLDSEWPARKANFERWLAPENFAPDGRQETSLSALNGVAP